MMRILGLLALAGAVLISGCQSAEERKREEALAKVAARKKPGMVRIVSLGTTPVTVNFKAQPLWPALTQNFVPRFAMVPAGEVTLKITPAGSSPTQVKFKFESTLAKTVLLLPDGKTTLDFPSRPTKPDDKGNVHAFFVEDGKVSQSAQVSIKGPTGASKMLTASAPDQNLMPGTYSFGGSDMKVDPAVSYTVVFIGSHGKFKAIFMKDTNTDKPVAGGAASA